MGVTEVPLNWIEMALAGGLTDVSATALGPDLSLIHISEPTRPY